MDPLQHHRDGTRTSAPSLITTSTKALPSVCHITRAMPLQFEDLLTLATAIKGGAQLCIAIQAGGPRLRFRDDAMPPQSRHPSIQLSINLDGGMSFRKGIHCTEHCHLIHTNQRQ